MECSGHDLALAHQDRITALRCQHLYIFASAHDFGRANEHQLQRRFTQLGYGFTNGTVNLAAISVAPYAYVKNAERTLRRVLNVFRQQDRSSTGAERRFRAYEIL